MSLSTVSILFFLLFPVPSVLITIYVTPSSQTECPAEPCHTLSEYIQDDARYMVSNTTMIFLAGEHVLTGQLSVANVDDFSVSGDSAEKVGSRVVCSGNESGGFTFENVSSLSVKFLSFNSDALSNSSFISVTNISDFTLTNCHFSNGRSTAVFAETSTLLLEGNVFENNSAIGQRATLSSGGGIAMDSCSVILQGENIFSNNSCSGDICGGGAIYAKDSMIAFEGNTKFDSNTIRNRLSTTFTSGGGGFFLMNCTINISGRVVLVSNNVESGFVSDGCQIAGGGGLLIDSSTSVSGEVLSSRNTAEGKRGCGGALYLMNSNFTVAEAGNVEFTSNSAGFSGGGLAMHMGSLDIDGALSLTSNTAQMFGGGLSVSGGSVAITGNLTSTYNFANRGGGSDLEGGKLRISGGVSYFENHANLLGGGLFMVNSDAHVSGEAVFASNYVASSDKDQGQGGGWDLELSVANISGTVFFVNNSASLQAGGLSIISSTAYISGNASFIKNSAQISAGGILINGSDVSLQHAQLTSNVAEQGGGMVLQESSLIVSENALFVNNSAQISAGGILVIESNVSLQDVLFISNQAKVQGGAMVLERSYLVGCGRINFTGNTASLGGAIFVHDKSNLVYCTSEILGMECVVVEDCFFQPLQSDSNTMVFEHNTAEAGSVLYGGSVDRCTLRDQANVRSGPVFDAITDYSKQPDTNSTVVSQPFRVCLCEGQKLMCNTRKNITAYPGETFTIRAASIGQRNGLVRADSWINAKASGPIHAASLGMFEDTQKVDQSDLCTNLNYTFFSNASRGMLNIYMSDLCSFLRSEVNQLFLEVILLPCPTAFSLSQAPHGCICEKRLRTFTNNCDINDQSILRDQDFWLGYSNQTNSQGLILHPHCPLHYCKSKTVKLYMDDLDLQCDHNRTGVLCGACPPGLSLALGSLRCLPCSNEYLFLIIAFAVMGLAFVLFLFFFRFTVTMGTLGGLLFYVNIVGANENTFFPFGKKNYLGSIVFISWLKLNLGIETCFYDGLDTYTFIWLQFAFPLYLFAIILLVIFFFKCFSKKLSERVREKFSPYDVMATLFIFSYGKILHTIISALSFTTLDYPSNKTEIVWLYDGNIKFLSSKHFPLFAVSLIFFVLVFLPFTLLLLFGECFKKLFRKIKFFSWLEEPVAHVLDIYYKPYERNYYYWPGLLLVVRLGLLVVFGENSLHRDNDDNLLAISAASFGLLAWPWMARGQVYTKQFAWRGPLEGSYLLNLGILAMATYYVRQAGGNQAIVTYLSTGVAFVFFVGILIFHLREQLKFWYGLRHFCIDFKLPTNKRSSDESRPLLNSIKL